MTHLCGGLQAVEARGEVARALALRCGFHARLGQRSLEPRKLPLGRRGLARRALRALPCLRQRLCISQSPLR
jgi:hypothetical protein